jgi:hypothetical protein
MYNVQQDRRRMITKSWARAGGWCGAAAATIYLSLVFLDLPRALGRVLFFGVSLLMVVAMLGIYHVLRAHRRSVTLDVAAVFMVAGAVIMNMMAVVQNTLLHYANASVPPDVDTRMVAWVLSSVHGVQLGLDVSFDIFFLTGIVLLGFAMARDPSYGAVFGLSGAAAAAATLVLNVVRFPVPPEPDLGPLVGLWALVASIRLLALARRFPHDVDRPAAADRAFAEV